MPAYDQRLSVILVPDDLDTVDEHDRVFGPPRVSAALSLLPVLLAEEEEDRLQNPSRVAARVSSPVAQEARNPLFATR